MASSGEGVAVMLDSAAAQSEHAAITREQHAEYWRSRDQQSKLREQQHDCELALQRPEYLTPEQKDATLVRYGKVTRELTTVARRLNELERDPLLRELLEAEGRRKDERAKETASADSGQQPQSNGPVLTKLSDVTPQPVRWLWRGRIPLGKVTVLDGDPGLGKSLLSTDITARTTTAGKMPNGTVSDLGEPAGVVILSAEDDLADTIRPRLEASDANLSHIVALTAVNAGGEARMPTLSDLGEIQEAIKQVNARLIIIDPLMAYLPGKIDSHRDQDIRRSLAPLAALAAETGVAVLVIRHLNKAEGRNALYRGGGSIGIIGAARSGLLVAKDPDDEERRILVVAKSNLAKPPPALAYRIIVNATEVPSLSWEGTTDHTAASLLAQPVDGEDCSTLEEAKDFLREVLANGAVLAKDVQKQAGQAGINERTLRRAKAALKIISRKQGGFFNKDKNSQQWWWVLPPSESQAAAEDGQAPTEDVQKDEKGHLQAKDGHLQVEHVDTRKEQHAKDLEPEDAEVIE